MNPSWTLAIAKSPHGHKGLDYTGADDRSGLSHPRAGARRRAFHILDVQGVPRFFSPIDRTLLKGFQSFGGYAPGVALPLVKEHMQKETANVILPAEREMLTHHLRERNREGRRLRPPDCPIQSKIPLASHAAGPYIARSF